MPPNKGMKLTSVERIERSQLIPGVLRTVGRAQGTMNLKTAVLLGLLVALAGCGGRDTAAPPPSDGQVVEKQPFTITLPGRWREEPAGDEDRWVFARADGKATLTVSGMSDPQRRSGLALQELVQGLVEMRRQVELEVSKQATQLEPVVVAQHGGAVVARYMGSEPTAGRQVAAVVMGRPGVVLTFYLETLDLSRTELEAIAKPMFNSIVLR